MSNLVSATRMPIAIIGAGGIGRAHVERGMRSDAVTIAAIADPAAGVREFAASVGVAWYADHRAMLDAVRPACAIVATPNVQHVDIGLDCIAHGVALLVEKPIADSVAQARRLCDAAAARGVPLMVGHQRRHNPIIAAARRMLAAGVLGRPVSVTAMSTWFKPDAYFDTAWRREAGGGPVLINLIHDIDLLRFLLGEITCVQAVTSNFVRRHAVEDTAAVMLTFANGALGAISVSDSAVAPWNWDLAAGEAAHYPRQDVNSHYLCGTEASLTLPRLEVWRYRGARGWHEPLTAERTQVHTADPYAEQLRHLRAVVEGGVAPICSGQDGLRTLEATLAVHTAAASGRPVTLCA